MCPNPGGFREHQVGVYESNFHFPSKNMIENNTTIFFSEQKKTVLIKNTLLSMFILFIKIEEEMKNKI